MAEGIFKRIKGLFGLSTIDDDFYDELEESLILADVGVETTMSLIEEMRRAESEKKVRTPEECRQLLIDYLTSRMCPSADAYSFLDSRCVILVVGVNGVGKTTTIGKLANLLKASGKKVILAAADTFRAGATEQLTLWANRAGVRIIAQGDGADPAAVVFDAVSAARSSAADVLICDTAGRLHNKKNLMDELSKMRRVLDREYPEARVQTLLVLDSTTGQNALAQAREFTASSGADGIVLTKMDGTAKGGIAIAIESELHIPVKYVGVGEGIEDLRRFDAGEYVRELFS